ncbi:MAG TPA: enoyl-CoA hydratase-related protein [Dehalococcoidia bacterium]|jgi:enoyl-CoA hydratase|nr:enoyl-CoA hydratase-related protein [Dehalococcoidia bacterium]
MGTTTISVDSGGAIARLTVTRLERENAIDAAVLRDLRAACEAIDEETRVVLLTGEGDVFSRGWDWEALLGETTDPVAAIRSAGIPPDPFGCLAELPPPVVCAINGDAVGAGLELALACDVRIAAEGATFSLPEVSMGMLPFAGGTQRLPRLVGRGRALEMILTGEAVDAGEALRIGLVSAIVPRERLLTEAEAMASRIAERGPLAVRYAKEAIARGLEMPLEQALRFETDLTIILQTTEDRAEGVRAFLEKRKAEFKGK